MVGTNGRMVETKESAKLAGYIPLQRYDIVHKNFFFPGQLK